MKTETAVAESAPQFRQYQRFELWAQLSNGVEHFVKVFASQGQALEAARHYLDAGYVEIENKNIIRLFPAAQLRQLYIVPEETHQVN